MKIFDPASKTLHKTEYIIRISNWNCFVAWQRKWNTFKRIQCMRVFSLFLSCFLLLLLCIMRNDNTCWDNRIWWCQQNFEYIFHAILNCLNRIISLRIRCVYIYIYIFFEFLVTDFAQVSRKICKRNRGLFVNDDIIQMLIRSYWIHNYS